MDEVSERKRKLKEIREKANKEASSSGTQDITVLAADDNKSLVETNARPLKFRNYQPYDASLLKKAAVEEEPTETEVIVESNASATIDPIKKELEAAQASVNDDELNLVPKKPNWDLKQQVAYKVEKLKMKTQRAIVEILREKIAVEGVEEDINE